MDNLSQQVGQLQIQRDETNDLLFALEEIKVDKPRPRTLEELHEKLLALEQGSFSLLRLYHRLEIQIRRLDSKYASLTTEVKYTKKEAQ